MVVMTTHTHVCVGLWCDGGVVFIGLFKYCLVFIRILWMTAVHHILPLRLFHIHCWTNTRQDSENNRCVRLTGRQLYQFILHICCGHGGL